MHKVKLSNNQQRTTHYLAWLLSGYKFFINENEYFSVLEKNVLIFND